MNTRPTLDEYFMNVAEVVATRIDRSCGSSRGRCYVEKGEGHVKGYLNTTGISE